MRQIFVVVGHHAIVAGQKRKGRCKDCQRKQTARSFFQKCKIAKLSVRYITNDFGYDQEAIDDEERIHSEIAARRNSHVVENDGHDCEPFQ